MTLGMTLGVTDTSTEKRNVCKRLRVYTLHNKKAVTAD